MRFLSRMMGEGEPLISRVKTGETPSYKNDENRPLGDFQLHLLPTYERVKRARLQGASPSMCEALYAEHLNYTTRSHRAAR